jgi:N-acylneuraminate cytidylyltransferase
MKSIAIITARGGSKRIPRKNIKLFLGQPIIKYSIDAALKAGCFDEVMVSTDDKEIAEISISCGAKVPFFRSELSSDDHASTPVVIEEVISEYNKRGITLDYVCCIYPTAPFLKAEKLKEAMDTLEKTGVDSVFPVVQFSYPIQRALKIESNNEVKMIWPENLNKRSQDLMFTYHDCGQFYALNTKSFLDQKKLFCEKSSPIIMSELEVQDIDNEEDWRIAELKYKTLIDLAEK